ncbi:hypothetical protein [Phycicoccus sp. HDW14]|nr:hypothetical protein [Phycicoccus sp. HDW14]
MSAAENKVSAPADGHAARYARLVEQCPDVEAWVEAAVRALPP